MELFVRRQDSLRRNKRADKIVGVDAFFRGMNGYTMRREGRAPDSIVQSCALENKEKSFTQVNVSHYSLSRGIKSFESCFEVLLKRYEKKGTRNSHQTGWLAVLVDCSILLQNDTLGNGEGICWILTIYVKWKDTIPANDADVSTTRKRQDRWRCSRGMQTDSIHTTGINLAKCVVLTLIAPHVQHESAAASIRLIFKGAGITLLQSAARLGSMPKCLLLKGCIRSQIDNLAFWYGYILRDFTRAYKTRLCMEVC